MAKEKQPISEERAQKLRKRWVKLNPQAPVPSYFPKLMVIGVIICIIAGVMTIGLFVSKIPEQKADVMDRKDAYMMAFNDSGAVKKETTFEVVRLEEDSDPIVYRVYFYDNDQYYKYLINAETAEIEKKKVLEGGHARYSEYEGTDADIDFSHDFD